MKNSMHGFKQHNFVGTITNYGKKEKNVAHNHNGTKNGMLHNVPLVHLTSRHVTARHVTTQKSQNFSITITQSSQSLRRIHLASA